ncbi:hypothetical protein [Alteribacter populi]|uniref:hypothetical protein n=1 Tax=Alteribacter populi TaxID=2011011 RepID=UPI0012FDDB0E|nr:hypothetical protein [Alteribacter populi]
MVNQNFEKFNKIQQKHKADYPGGENAGKSPMGRSNDTNDRDSSISVGAEGRDIPSKK